MPEKFKLELFLAEKIFRTKKTSLFHQIYENLRKAILSNHLQKGIQLPATRVLAKDLKVSRNTVMAVYDQLIAEGYLQGKIGAGTFVAENIPTDFFRTTKAQKPNLSKSSRQIAERGNLFWETSFTFTNQPNKPRAFQTGFSAIDEFPLEIWSRITSKRLRKMPRKLLDYFETQGYPILREEIAKYLSASRGVLCEAEQVFIVAGSQQGLDLTARVLLDVGDSVWMEDPNYIGAKGAFLGAGAKLIHIPVDSEGLNVKFGKQLPNKIRLAYVTPSHQFPLGVVLSLSRRLELLEWANQNSAWIVEDDYDSEFRYEGKPLMALHGLDTDNRVIYLGTFSKVLFPSLRLGYLVVPPDLIAYFTKMLSFISNHAPMIEQIVLTDFIREGHFGRHIRRMRQLYAERQKILINAINENLSEFLEVKTDPAGMHLVAWLKNNLIDNQVAQKALEYGVYTPPVSFYCSNVKVPEGLLMGYTGVNATEILNGVTQLKTMFENHFR